MLEYDNDTHTYKIDGKAVKSVTELAKEFSGLDTTWLEKNPSYAEKGTIVHEQLSSYINGEADVLNETARDILDQFKKWFGEAKNWEANGWKSERLVYNKEKEYAGTLDLVQIENGVCKNIVDFKSGTTENKNYFTCQLNLYRLALESMGVKFTENTHMWIVNPKKVIMIKSLDWDQLKRIKSLDDLVLTSSTGEEVNDIEKRMYELEPYIAEYNELKARLSGIVLENMKSSGKKKYDTWMYNYTYVPGTVRRTLDKDKVEALVGDQIESCYKETQVKETIKLKRWED